MYEKTFIMDLASYWIWFIKEVGYCITIIVSRISLLISTPLGHKMLLSDTLYTKEGGEKNTFKELLGGLKQR